MTSKNRDDRRSHIRIKDRILLYVQPITEDDYQARIKAFREGTDYPLSECTYLVNVQGIDSTIRKIKERDEAMARAIEIIDQKLNMVINLLSLDLQEECPAKPHVVDMSAAGIAYGSGKSVKLGQKVQLDIGLLPEHNFLRCYGEITRCDKVAGKKGYSVAVKFIWITESDRDRLVEHIFQKQVLQLRIRREQKDLQKSAGH